MGLLDRLTAGLAPEDRAKLVPAVRPPTQSPGVAIVPVRPAVPQPRPVRPVVIPDEIIDAEVRAIEQQGMEDQAGTWSPSTVDRLKRGGEDASILSVFQAVRP